MRDQQSPAQGPPANPSFDSRDFTSLRFSCFAIRTALRYIHLHWRAVDDMQWRQTPVNLRVPAVKSHGMRHPHGGVTARQLRGALLIHRSHHQRPQIIKYPLLPHLQLQNRSYSDNKFNFDANPETSFLERIGLRRKQHKPQEQTKKLAAMSSHLYTEETPDDVKNAKGLHLITMSTPNGQAVQIFLEELKDAYGTEWTTTLVDIRTNDQKKDWFLRLDPNGAFDHRTRYEHRRRQTDNVQAAFRSWSITPKAHRLP